MDGTNANFHENLLTSDADVQTVNTSWDTKDCSLKYKPFPLLVLRLWLEENAEGLTSFFPHLFGT